MSAMVFSSLISGFNTRYGRKWQMVKKVLKSTVGSVSVSVGVLFASLFVPSVFVSSVSVGVLFASLVVSSLVVSSVVIRLFLVAAVIRRRLQKGAIVQSKKHGAF